MRNRKNFSRKTRGIILILTAFVAVLVLSACGNSNSSGSGGNSGGSSSSSSSSSSLQNSGFTYDQIMSYINQHGYNNSNPGGDWENPSDGSLSAGDYFGVKSNPGVSITPNGKDVYSISNSSGTWTMTIYKNFTSSGYGSKTSEILTDLSQIPSAK